MARITQRLIEAAREAGAGEGVAPAALVAVSLVETDGRSLAAVGTRFEPLIRFEGHHFDRRLAGEPRRLARAAGLSHPRIGGVRNPVSQEGRWRLLELAGAIDREAAYASTSWGLGQVMGSHARSLGFSSALALAEAARGSVAGQLVLVARFLRLNKLEELLPAGDWKGFSRRYNGPAFARNRYDAKIAAAYREVLAALGPANAASLR